MTLHKCTDRYGFLLSLSQDYHMHQYINCSLFAKEENRHDPKSVDWVSRSHYTNEEHLKNSRDVCPSLHNDHWALKSFIIGQRMDYVRFKMPLIITKTRLFKYTENFTTITWKFSDKSSDIFSYFCSKHRLWVLDVAVLTSTHNLCFEPK